MHRTHTTNVQSPPRTGVLLSARGFSVLEMLFATALLALMATLVVPSIEGGASAGGRKGAVIIVMNALEHARVTAITKNMEIQVFLWTRNGDSRFQPDERDALMVAHINQNNEVEPLTRWIPLPRGVLFHETGSDATSGFISLPSAEIDPGLDVESFPGDEDPLPQDLAQITFNSAGALDHGENPEQLFIALTEGQRGADGTLAVDRQKAGGQEIIGLARLTGRATLDISTL